MSVSVLIDVAGWAGAAALLVGYAGVSAGRLQARALPYQLLNLGGSLGLLANAAWYRAFPSAFVNAVWIAVAGIALAGLLRRRGPS